MIVENTKHAAKTSFEIQYFIQIAVVILVTKAECVLGIHHDHKTLLKEKALILFKYIHFITTENIHEKTGTRIILFENINLD